MQHILAFTDAQDVINTLKLTVGDRFEIKFCNTLESCLENFSATRPEITFIDLRSLLPEGFASTTSVAKFKSLFQPFKDLFSTAPLVVVSSQDQQRNLIQAVKGGAKQYLVDPIDPQALLHVIDDLAKRMLIRQELELLRHKYWDDDKAGVTNTNSPVMTEMFTQAHSVAATDSSVLLLGETGVGKGVLSKFIHRNSNRRSGPFVHVHCGAIPENLIESELFGHEKGAFTGAIKRKLGRFEIAKNGTIFLDEIGTISPSLQTKLLQVLQDHMILRVGGENMVETNVRVIAATNEDLLARSQKGEFREDLYYRLNVFPIHVPPLRERMEDIPLLADNFFRKLEGEYNKKIEGIAPATYHALQRYAYPGNIRELENILERAYILEKGTLLSPQSLPSDFLTGDIPASNTSAPLNASLAEIRRHAIEIAEKAYLTQLLAQHQGKINLTADAAGITTRQLHKLLTKYQIKKEDFKPAYRSSST